MNRFVKGNPLFCLGCRTCMVACVVAHRGNGIFTTDPESEDFYSAHSCGKKRKLRQ